MRIGNYVESFLIIKTHHHPLPSVEPPPAVLGSTEALELLKVGIEVVVERQLLFRLDVPNGDENDVGASVDVQVLTAQVRVARVVDVPRFASIESGVDDVVLVKAEQVAVTHAQHCVVLLSLVCHGDSDLLADILDHNILGVDPAKTLAK